MQREREREGEGDSDLLKIRKISSGTDEIGHPSHLKRHPSH
jgi:hypothetical protein